jgi:hypothetical protein
MAQLAGAAFLTKWAGLFADNSTGDISAEDMRDFRQDLVDSFPNFLDDAYESFVVTASGTNTYTATLSPVITSYASNHRYFIKFTNANTGAATLNLNGLGAKSIVKNGNTALVSGDIAAGQILAIAYDGTNLQIIGGGSSSALSGLSGSYTPTNNDNVNVNSLVMRRCNYYRINDMVTVSGRFSLLATAAGQVVFDMSIPIASSFSDQDDASGPVTGSEGEGYGVIFGAGSEVEVRIEATSTNFVQYHFTFTYKVI